MLCNALDRIEIRGVGRQIEEMASRLLDQFLDAPSFIEGGIIADDDLSI